MLIKILHNHSMTARLENKKYEGTVQYLYTSHPGHRLRFGLHLCSHRGFRRSSCCSTRWCSFFKALNSSSSWWCHGYRTKTWNASAEEATPKLMSEIPRVIHMAKQTEDWSISGWAENEWIEDLQWRKENVIIVNDGCNAPWMGYKVSNRGGPWRKYK